jgi:hypothetical protein
LLSSSKYKGQFHRLNLIPVSPGGERFHFKIVNEFKRINPNNFLSIIARTDEQFQFVEQYYASNLNISVFDAKEKSGGVKFSEQ